MDEKAIIIGGNKKKALLLLAISAAFVAIGISTVGHGQSRGWWAIGFFSLGGFFALYMLLPNTIRLAVDERGIEMKTLFKPIKLSWSDIDSFYVGRIKTRYSSTELIGIRYSPAYNKMRVGREIASALTGMQAALPNHFNMPAEELCALLNEWKKRDSMRAQQTISADRREDAAPAER